jgi:MoaA/NifB/PqqE/SkfB family radical SAM enzyme
MRKLDVQSDPQIKRNKRLELLSIEDFNYSPTVISGFAMRWVLLKIYSDLSWQFLKKYKNPFKLWGMVKKLNAKKKEVTFGKKMLKLAKVNGKHYFTPVGFIGGQGWPSKHYYRNFLVLAREFMTNDVTPSEDLGLAYVAITKKCPMRCEHCYEWDELNKKEVLKMDELKAIVKRFQDAGVSQIVFAGGEPMSRVKGLVELLATAERKTDFWVSTSGFNFTRENALTLKAAGLTGVNISLDHHDKNAHNLFRGNTDAFDWVLNAAKNAYENELITSFDLCPVRSFCTMEDLMKYAEIVKRLGGAFIQIYEPRDVGHYAGKDVLLKDEHKAVLNEFFFKLNFDPAYKDYPIVAYVDMVFNNIGCSGSGNRFLYVDTNGMVNPCPLCRSKSMHILDANLDEVLVNLRGEGCSNYKAQESAFNETFV